jgi:WD40 repeat protein
VVDISPDGRYAAVGGHDGDLLVLDLDTGHVVRPPVRGHGRGTLLLSLVYSADGAQILTTASDSTTVLWDGRTGLVDAQVVTPLRFSAATFIAHGDDVLIAPEDDGPVFRWSSSIDYAMRFACSVAGRDLTKASGATSSAAVPTVTRATDEERRKRRRGPRWPRCPISEKWRRQWSGYGPMEKTRCAHQARATR